MRILNRTHVPWAIFFVGATVFATWLYVGNFHRGLLPMGAELPARWVQKTSEHRSVGGTPLGLAFGAIALAIFIFASLLGVRKKFVLWRVGTVQRWLRAHIWLTLLTIPLVFLHSGFRFGGPMTTLLVVLYVIVMVSGLYGLALQHQMPHIMMERLPAESVYEQIPHIRAQLVAAAQKLRDSFKPTATGTGKTDAGAPAPSAARTVTAGSTPMASTASALSTPTARAKSTVGSTITAEPLAGGASTPAASPRPPAGVAATTAPAAAEPAEVKPAAPAPSAAKAAQPNENAAATVAQSATPPKPAVAATPKVAAPAAKAPVAPTDAASEAALADFLDRQILPYLSAIRGDRMRLGNPRFSEDTFRFVKLRVTPAYRQRVEEIQAWCDERRMLDLQTKLQHWLHGWLFVHAPVSFLLLIVTFWHAFVTLFHY